MKRLFAVAVALLFLTPLMFANPVLISDPYPKTGWQPDHFTLKIDAGTAFTIPIKKNANGEAYVWYDLKDVTVGEHTFQVSAGDVWGESITVPFQFTRPSLPLPAPGNVSISSTGVVP